MIYKPHHKFIGASKNDHMKKPHNRNETRSNQVRRGILYLAQLFRQIFFNTQIHMNTFIMKDDKWTRSM